MKTLVTSILVLTLIGTALGTSMTSVDDQLSRQTSATLQVLEKLRRDLIAWNRRKQRATSI